MEAVELAYDEYATNTTDHKKCPIIFLHGLFWNKFMLRELAEDMCEATRRKVYTLDLRNHDQSPFREECDATLMAEDIKKFIQDRQLEKIAFVCHSVSCTIAYQVIVDQPEKIEKVVMIDHPPFPHYTEEFYREQVLPQFTTQQRFLEKLDPSMSLAAAKKKILNLCNGAQEGQVIFMQKIAYELIKVNGRFDWKTNHQFLIDHYHEGYFRPKPRGSSNHEILIIRSKDSPRVSDKKFAAVKRFNPNATLMSLPGTTHLLMFEKKDEFVGAVKDFLA